jgi:uncharacterized protein
MVIRVSEIPEQGRIIEGVEGGQSPFQDPRWALEGLSLFVEKDKDDVLVRGWIRSRIPLTCSRCLEPFPMAVKADLDVRLAPRSKWESEEVELSADDLEVDFYADNLLDLDRLIETETTLRLPMKPLCREECRGLCPICGGNRNQTPCECRATPPDLRLQALKALGDRLRQR